MFSFKFYLFCISANFIIALGQQPDKFFRSDYAKYLPDTDSFYKIQTVHKSWEQAKENCEIEGAELFYPDDEEEAQAVIAYWNATQPFYWVYIGVSANIVPEVFYTVNGLSINSVYNKWGPGEPNNAGGVESCVIMRRDGTLNDDRCDKAYPYICKKRASTIQWNLQCDMPDPNYKYVEQLGRCYKFHTKPRNWTDAFRVCSSEQGYLAIPDSQGEMNHFVNLTKFAKKDDVEGKYLRGAIHLGFVKKDYEWRSIRGRPLKHLGYKTWGSNQPDGGDNENCGSMFHSGKLNDIACNKICFFICEREIPLLENSLTIKFGDYGDVQ